MSRSIGGSYAYICGSNNKKARTYANHQLRHINKAKLRIEGEEFIPKLLREVSCVWAFSTDGLAYYTDRADEQSVYRGYCSHLSSYLNGNSGYSRHEIADLCGDYSDGNIRRTARREAMKWKAR